MQNQSTILSILVQEKFRQSTEQTRTVIDIFYWIFMAIASIVTVYEFSKLPLFLLFNDDNSIVIRQIALAFMAFCWLIGSKFDTHTYEEALKLSITPPSSTKKDWVLCGLVFILFLLLIFVTYENNFFLITLTLFQLYNTCAYFYLTKKFYNAAITESLAEAKNSCCPEQYPVIFVQIQSAIDYLFGKWQKIRLYTLNTYLFICLVISIYYTEVQNIEKSITYNGKNFLFFERMSDREFITYSFIIYLTISEGWMFYMRFKNKIINKNAAKYCGTKCCICKNKNEE